VFILFQFHVVIKILFILILIIILDYKNFMKLNKFKIFESTYKDLLNKYLSKSKNKIKQIYTDTSTFYNKYNKDNVERNKYFKNKKVMKLSLITNQKGIPLNIDLFKGNLNHINIFNKKLDKLDIKLFNKNLLFLWQMQDMILLS